ncbi:YbhB/YbcL family Raf kinase inhibitor-like protein [Rhizobium sp. LEGMi198b]|uniref:YbhB/YbcL family Raf kinase inhibitor-like protein n=1 Tax=unclassified Rhizobium TaxID=2613769 RepID=UPI000CDF3451|nr:MULTISPECIES: YbhB/YbcL family Raf kinase inhibitor-like protein [Rhizobium]AVA21837.1 phosphatidylethanolamine-binding protein [Rhizobium sp. NXC24]MDK4737763.1 YbhB/YbcL family Raf kinase inhibitor-like protein [Rhizobium sp. CNPSo 3464]UWU22889.1 YbhB/YbcL family Raf kinase inhibitor-like protein [Rhizobium tropici]WFU03676.1 YbhB/YbcL family Raf kinase inhibitor-like protein [Rhizobium sp. CB3171]
MKYSIAAALAATLLASGQASAFELASPDMKDSGTLKIEQVANVFGCKGGNVSPALSWKDAPEGTKSFVVTLYDPDAPTGSGWWHWTVFDIPASAKSLPSGAGSTGGTGLPSGAIQGRTDFGTSGFGGACPPPGPAHRYKLTVTALKVDKLGLDSNASGALVGYMTQANALASASITATYGQ